MASPPPAARACSIVSIASLAWFALPAVAQETAPERLDRVTVTGPRPSSIPTEIPTTTESITRDQIDTRINATDAEDVLKYFPSLNVRKRYIGDYDHAVLGSRASGTGNSARSLVYADGILLSNLLGNGATFTPRWGLVTPGEIERVDVLYGPFSAAYPGNSVGAVVDYVTRMPRETEAHVKVGGFLSHFRDVYSSDGRYGGGSGSIAIGSRAGGFSWWIDYDRLDSEAQPIVFANRLVSAGIRDGGGVPVSGAVFDRNPKNQNWWILGSTTQTHTTQDQGKAKVAYDFTPDIRLTYVYDVWHNQGVRSTASSLRDPAGNPVTSGAVSIDGLTYTLTPSDFAPNRTALTHVTHGITLKSDTRSWFDFDVAASFYDYRKDQVRAPTVLVGSPSTPGAGTITDQRGTGWSTVAAKGTWRPDPSSGRHVVEGGVQRDAFRLRTRVSATGNWIADDPRSLVSRFDGDTDLTSFWLQDAWRVAPTLKAILGVRVERWTAHDGLIANASRTQGYAPRRQSATSPKAAVGYSGVEDWEFRASYGHALRFPTVSELYQGAIVGNVVVNNDPGLRPERSDTGELTAERSWDKARARLTYFHETTHDALYSQTDVTVLPNVTNIQNVDRVRSNGLEFAATTAGWPLPSIDLAASATYARSTITADARFPAAVGKDQPRVPRWRGTATVTWRPTDAWTATLGARYSGVQYGTLDNSDPNGFTYTGFSSYLVFDARVRCRFDRHWSASAGVDNFNDKTYWAFHPYPKRTFLAEVGYDL